MEKQPEPYIRRPGLIRLVGCLAYPLGAAIVGGLVLMIARIV